MSIYLTYYKDVVFSFVTLANYCGMLTVTSWQLQLESQNEEGLLYKKTLNISHWLITLVVLNFVSLLMTVIVDYNKAFYRKAIIYKKRVAKALKKRRKVEQANPDESIDTSQQRAGSLFGSIQSTTDEKCRTQSFNRYMMYEKLQRKYEAPKSDRGRNERRGTGYIEFNRSRIDNMVEEYQSMPKQKTLQMKRS